MKIISTTIKGIAAFVLGLALVSAPIKAQTVEQKITTALSTAGSNQEKIYAIHDLLQTASNTRDSLKAEGAKAEARLADVNQQSANFTATIARHNAIATEHDQRVAIHDGRADSHNANRCVYYNGRSQDCAAYDNEQTQLNNEAAGLDRERDQINQEKQTLDAAGQGLQLEIDDYNKYKDGFNSRLDSNNHDIDTLMKVLAALQKTNVTCQDVLKDPKSTGEQIHAICGGLFDGNQNNQPLNRTGTGGASQNK